MYQHLRNALNLGTFVQEGFPVMIFRVPLLLACRRAPCRSRLHRPFNGPAPGGWPSQNFAKRPGIVLEQVTFTVSTGVVPWLPAGVKLPKIGSCVLLDEQQGKALCEIVQNDKRSDVLPTLSLRNGENWRDSQGPDYFRTPAPDRRPKGVGIKLHVAFARGVDRVVADKTVPRQGSHMLVHYAEIAERPDANYLEQLCGLDTSQSDAYPRVFRRILTGRARLASPEEQQHPNAR